MSPTPEPAAGPGLVAAVRRAVEDADRDLERMPFFVRPLARRGFARRTGLGLEGWLRLLGGLPAGPPASLRSQQPELQGALERLAQDFRSAPERARRGMGDRPELLRELSERAQARAQAVQALLDWLRG